jgi:hypothetical protein
MAYADCRLRHEVGKALPSGIKHEKDFAWSPDHPIVEAYRAYQPMPYDAPTGLYALIRRCSEKSYSNRQNRDSSA